MKTFKESPPELYHTWSGMRQRCNNPKANNYKYYGGRGIKVCDRWNIPGGYRVLLADVGSRPSPQHSLERIDNDGDYEPSNVKWADRNEQMKNTRKTRIFTIKGSTKTLSEWISESGLNYSTVTNRFYTYGWSIEDALFQPLTKGKHPNG